MSDNDVQGTEIDEKYIHVFPPKKLSKKEEEFLRVCTGMRHSLQLSLCSQVTHHWHPFKVHKLFYFCISDKYSSFDDMWHFHQNLLNQNGALFTKCVDC